MGNFAPEPDPLQRRLHEDPDALTAPARHDRAPRTGDPSGPRSLRARIGAESGQGSRIGRFLLAAVGGAVGFSLHPVCTVDVEGSVVASSVEMVTTRPHIVALNAPVRVLAVHGYTRVTGVPTSGRGSLTALPAAGGVLELEQITIPMGALLTVMHEAIGGLNLRMEPGTGPGQVRFNVPSGGYVLTGADTLAVEPGAAVVVEFDSLRFNLWFAPNSPRLDLFSQLPMRELAFTETIVGADGLQEERIARSTVRGGTLTLPAVGQEIPLRAGEEIEMRLQAVRIDQLRSDTGGIAVTFRARAERLALGEDATRRTLKPTYLQALGANPFFALISAAVTVASGALTFVINRPRRR